MSRNTVIAIVGLIVVALVAIFLFVRNQPSATPAAGDPPAAQVDGAAEAEVAEEEPSPEATEEEAPSPLTWTRIWLLRGGAMLVRAKLVTSIRYFWCLKWLSASPPAR